MIRNGLFELYAVLTKLPYEFDTEDGRKSLPQLFGIELVLSADPAPRKFAALLRQLVTRALECLFFLEQRLPGFKPRLVVGGFRHGRLRWRLKSRSIKL